MSDSLVGVFFGACYPFVVGWFFPRILEEQGVPLLLIRPYGLMGFLRIQSPSYSILETFPDQQACMCQKSAFSTRRKKEYCVFLKTWVRI